MSFRGILVGWAFAWLIGSGRLLCVEIFHLCWVIVMNIPMHRAHARKYHYLVVNQCKARVRLL